MRPLSRPKTFDRTKVKPPFHFLLSCKFDGIRFSIQDNDVYSRTGKLIPNKHIRKTIMDWGLPPGIDGELVCGSFQETTSSVMTIEGEPEFSVFVFDIMSDEQFSTRYYNLYRHFSENYDLNETRETPKVLGIADKTDMVCNKYAFGTMYDNLWLVKHRVVITDEEIANALNEYKDSEGVILRDPDSLYYDTIWKIKHKLDSDAKIIKVLQLKRKTGELAEQMGSLLVSDVVSGKQFNIGTGFTKSQRIQIWDTRDDLIGQFLKYEYDSLSSHGIPRFPRFAGIRSEKDII